MKLATLALLAGLLCLGAPLPASAEDMCNINYVPSGPWQDTCKNHFWSHCNGTDFSCKTFHAACRDETIYREISYNNTEMDCQKVKACNGKLKNKDGKLVCN